MKKTIIINCIVAFAAVATGCNDWLNPERGDKILEKDAYMTELGINNVLNGIYRSLMSDALYGNKFTAGTVDFLAQYYDYPDETTKDDKTNLAALWVAGEYRWLQEDGKYRESFIDPIWKSGYKLILGINNFISKMERLEDGILSEDRRKLYIGEAIALRAMLHLDLYRLFGPLDLSAANTLPYHSNAIIEVPANLGGTAFMGKVMEDLDRASGLLAETDPVKLDGKVWDGRNDDDEMTGEERFATMFRNKRMNYWAVQVLRMRVNTMLNTAESRAAVITAADEFMAGAVDHDYTEYRENPMTQKAKPFGWMPMSTLTNSSIWANNPILYDEVIMGPLDISQEKWWTDHMGLTKASDQSRVFISSNLGINIMGSTAPVNAETNRDMRKNQYATAILSKNAISDASLDYYVSRKYQNQGLSYLNTKGSMAYNTRNMRALIRLAEVQYMKAEALLNSGDAGGAAAALNVVLLHRGYLENASDTYSPTEQLHGSATEEEVLDMLTREYYREFVYEGQAFYFIKRRAAIAGTNSYPIFKGNYNIMAGELRLKDITRAQLVPPLPESENQ